MRIYLSLCLFLISIPIYAQFSTNLDSLRNSLFELEKLPIDTNLSNASYNVAASHFRANKDSSIVYLKKSLDVAQKVGFPRGEQRSSYLLAQIHKVQKQYDKALTYVEICIQAMPSKTVRHTRCLKMAGDINRNLSNYEEAIKYYDEAERIGIKAKDSLFISMLYNSLGAFYENLDEKEKAVKNYLQSAELDKLISNDNGYLISMANVASLYLDQLEPQKAKQYIQKARQVLPDLNDKQNLQILLIESDIISMEKNYSESIKSYNKALELAEKMNFPQYNGHVYFNMANDYAKLKKYADAEKFLQKGLEYSQEPRKQFNYYELLASILVVQGRCEVAKEWIEKADKILHLIERYSDIRSYYTSKAKYNYCIGNTKLGHSLIDSFYVYSDSIYFERKEFDGKKIEAQYQTRIKEDSIRILGLQNKEQTTVVKNQKRGLLVSLICTSLLGLLVFYYIRYTRLQKKINNLLKEDKQNLESENKNLVFEKSELVDVNRVLKEKLSLLSIETSKLELPKLELKGANKIHFIDPLLITYISAEDDGIRIHTNNGSTWFDMSLKKILAKLPQQQFLKIYRSTIINLKYLEWVNHATLRLNEGTELKIGRTFKEDILKRFNKD